MHATVDVTAAHASTSRPRIAFREVNITDSSSTGFHPCPGGGNSTVETLFSSEATCDDHFMKFFHSPEVVLTAKEGSYLIMVGNHDVPVFDTTVEEMATCFCFCFFVCVIFSFCEDIKNDVICEKKNPHHRVRSVDRGSYFQSCGVLRLASRFLFENRLRTPTSSILIREFGEGSQPSVYRKSDF